MIRSEVGSLRNRQKCQDLSYLHQTSLFRVEMDSVTVVSEPGSGDQKAEEVRVVNINPHFVFSFFELTVT